MFNLMKIKRATPREIRKALTTDVHGERIGIVKCDMADFLWVCGCRRECDNRYITKIDKVNRQASRISLRVIVIDIRTSRVSDVQPEFPAWCA